MTKDAEIATVRAEVQQQSSEVAARAEQQAAQIAELQSHLSEMKGRVAYLEGRVEELVDEKADLEHHYTAADINRDLAIEEAVAVVIERDVAVSARNEAVAAGEVQIRGISELSQRVVAQEAELVEARTAISGLSQRVAVQEAELTEAREALKDAVRDYLDSPDFVAAIDDSCAEGSRLMRDVLVAAFPDIADRLRREADVFLQRAFPNLGERATPPPEGLDPPPNDSANV